MTLLLVLLLLVLLCICVPSTYCTCRYQLLVIFNIYNKRKKKHLIFANKVPSTLCVPVDLSCCGGCIDVAPKNHSELSKCMSTKTKKKYTVVTVLTQHLNLLTHHVPIDSSCTCQQWLIDGCYSWQGVGRAHQQVFMLVGGCGGWQGAGTAKTTHQWVMVTGDSLAVVVVDKGQGGHTNKSLWLVGSHGGGWVVLCNPVSSSNPCHVVGGHTDMAPKNHS